VGKTGAVGCVAVIGSFIFLFAILPMLFATINTWFTLNLLFVLLAILTLLLSFIARKQLNR
jgi:hypothetical protein